MKILIMCEGPNEKAVIDILLENNCFVFSRDDLLGLVSYHARQIASSGQVRAALNIYPGNDVVIFRVGDKLNEKLLVPSAYQYKIKEIRKYCTKPELEMLFIIAEGMFKAFSKEKSTVKPKTFAKEHIKCGKKRYDNSTHFYYDYFSSNVNVLIEAIREYHKLNKAHKKDELYLASLLK